MIDAREGAWVKERRSNQLRSWKVDMVYTWAVY
jgi:hypothetical protein